MHNRLLFTLGALTLITSTASAQQYQRRANLTGGGNPDSGKCTVEVVVDGAAEVEINGDNATMRNLSGQPPQWRRFECTSRMPNNPANFRFQGIDGRGRVDLVRDPRNGGAAVVRIEDKDGGAEGYTFDIMWGGGAGYRTGNQYPPQGHPPQAYPQPYDNRPQYGDRNIGGIGRRFTADQAVNICRDDVRQRAAQRFGTPNIQFQNMRVEDNPDRRDWVVGTFTTPRFGNRSRLHEFACSVNFDTGQVRWAQIDPENGRFGNADRVLSSPDAVRNCESAVQSRVRQRGFRNVQFGRINVDDNPGRNDWVVGWVRADGEQFDFSCRVNLNDGDVRSVDLTRR